jgi:hypothetical protein
MIKSKRMRWIKHVAGMGQIRNANTVSLTNLKGREHLGDLGVEGRILLVLLEWILKMLCGC